MAHILSKSDAAEKLSSPQQADVLAGNGFPAKSTALGFKIGGQEYHYTTIYPQSKW